jgi:hypothetical protein
MDPYELIHTLLKSTPTYLCGSLITSIDYEITGDHLKWLWKYHCSRSEQFNQIYTRQSAIFHFIESQLTPYSCQDKIRNKEIENFEKPVDTTYQGHPNYIEIYEKNAIFSQLFESHIHSNDSHLILYIVNNENDSDQIFFQLHSNTIWYQNYQQSLKNGDLLNSFAKMRQSPFKMFYGQLKDFNIAIPQELKNQKLIIATYSL